MARRAASPPCSRCPRAWAGTWPARWPARGATPPAVPALSGGVGRDVARPLADLRDKTVLSFDRKSITAVDLDVAGDRMTVEPQESGTRQITKPRALKADADLIADFLDKLAPPRAQGFVDDKIGRA